MAAALIEPSRPQNAYWLWLSEHRDAISKEAVSAKGSDVGKLAGTKWKALAANVRAPYEKRAAEKKAAYERAMEEFKAAGGVAGKRRAEKAEAKKDRAFKKARKEARKASGKPSKPPTAGFLYLNAEGREAAQKELGTKDFGPVTKLAWAKFGALPAAKKATYEKKAAELKAEYNKLMAEWKAQQGNKENADDNDEDEGEEDEDEEE